MEKGICLKKSTLYNKKKKMNSRLLRQASAIEGLMYTYKNMVTVVEEIAQYDYIFKACVGYFLSNFYFFTK